MAAPLTERLWELAAASADRTATLYAEVLYGCGRFVQGDLEGAARHTAVWPELLRLEGPVVAGSFLAESVVLYQGFSYQVATALGLLDEIESQIRRHCASGALVSVLGARSLVCYGVDLRDCVAAGREALHLSEETDQPGLTTVAVTTLAIAAATVGDEALTNEVCDRLLAMGELRYEVWARAALGRLHLVHGRPEAAAAQFALPRDQVGDRNISYTQFEADEAEAFVRVGRIDDARALLPVLAETAATMGPWAVGMHERIRALVSPDIDEANVHFEAAQVALAQTDNRIAQGLVELTWGERLRRVKRRAEARRRLERAVELFGRVGRSACVGGPRRSWQPLAVWAAVLVPPPNCPDRWSCRSPGWPSGAPPTATSPTSCSSAPVRSRTTSGRCTASSASRVVRLCSPGPPTMPRYGHRRWASPEPGSDPLEVGEVARRTRVAELGEGPQLPLLLALDLHAEHPGGVGV